MIKSCNLCGKEYETDNNKRKFCSRECFNLFQDKKKIVACDTCGKHIKRQLSSIGKTNFCSENCLHKWQAKNWQRYPELLDKEWCIEQYGTKSLLEIAELLGCGETTVWKYFNRHGIKRDRSRSLMGKAKSKEHRNNLSLSRMGKFLGEDNPNWKGGITELGLHIRSLKQYDRWRKAVMRSSAVCCFCGTDKNLEADHIKKFAHTLRDNDITSAQKARECKELWDVANGRVLCRSCNIGREVLDKLS